MSLIKRIVLLCLGIFAAYYVAVMSQGIVPAPSALSEGQGILFVIAILALSVSTLTTIVVQIVYLRLSNNYVSTPWIIWLLVLFIGDSALLSAVYAQKEQTLWLGSQSAPDVARIAMVVMILPLLMMLMSFLFELCEASDEHRKRVLNKKDPVVRRLKRLETQLDRVTRAVGIYEEKGEWKEPLSTLSTKTRAVLDTIGCTFDKAKKEWVIPQPKDDLIVAKIAPLIMGLEHVLKKMSGEERQHHGRSLDGIYTRLNRIIADVESLGEQVAPKGNGLDQNVEPTLGSHSHG